MRLKEFRNLNDLTQTELLEILKENGFKCNQQFLSHVERGISKPPYEMMEAFKKAFEHELVDTWFF